MMSQGALSSASTTVHAKHEHSSGFIVDAKVAFGAIQHELYALACKAGETLLTSGELIYFLQNASKRIVRPCFGPLSTRCRMPVI